MRTLVLINGKEIVEAARVKEIAGKFYHAKEISINKTREIIEEEATVAPSFTEKEIRDLGKGEYPKYLKVVTEYSDYFGWSSTYAEKVNEEDYISYIENEYEGISHEGSSYRVIKANSFEELEDFLKGYEDDLYFQNGNISYIETIEIEVTFRNGSKRAYKSVVEYDHRFGNYGNESEYGDYSLFQKLEEYITL